MFKAVDILEIVDSYFMQNVQDFFAKTMNVALVSVVGDRRLTSPSNSTGFCKKYNLESSLGHEHCKMCHKKWEDAVIKKGKPITFKCHLGLMNFAIPVIIEGKYFASVIGGQVFSKQPDEKYFRKIADEFGIKEESYISELNNIKIIPEHKFEVTVDALSRIVNSVASIAYANFLLSSCGIDYKVPRNIAIEEWLFLNCEDIHSPITGREFEILKLIVMGKSNTEIAKELFISVHTAKAHVSSILEKFSVEDRVQVAVKAVREGLI